MAVEPEAPTSVPQAPAPRRPGDLAVLARIALLALGIRVAMVVLGAIAVAQMGRPFSLDLWVHWDASNFVRVAEVGYPAEGHDALFVVYPPFYPLAVFIASVAFRDAVLSSLVVSFAACTAAAWFLYKLVRLDAGPREAWRAVVLLFAFPTAYFLAAPYSESLFLLGAIGCVFAARTGRWGWAAAAGALATGTRLVGLALVPALVADALRGPRTRRELVSRLACVAVVPAGFVVYLAINQLVHGDPLHFLSVQRDHWQAWSTAPWVPVVEAVRSLGDPSIDGDFAWVYRGRLAALIAGAGLLALGSRRLRRADLIYGWAALAMVLSISWLISLPRYLLGIYPLFVVLAHALRRRTLWWPTVMLGAGVQAWFFWRYAQGWWTF